MPVPYDHLRGSEQDELFTIQALLFTLKKAIPKTNDMKSARAYKVRLQIELIEKKMNNFITSINTE